jgi:hypothetical protein
MTVIHDRGGAVRHPARIVPLAFLAAGAVGTALIMLPAARAEAGHAPFVTAVSRCARHRRRSGDRAGLE